MQFSDGLREYVSSHSKKEDKVAQCLVEQGVSSVYHCSIYLCLCLCCGFHYSQPRYGHRIALRESPDVIPAPVILHNREPLTQAFATGSVADKVGQGVVIQ
jgi:hypothetical protein